MVLFLISLCMLLLTRVCGITGSASTRRWGGYMGSILGPSRVIAKDVKSCTYCCYSINAAFYLN